MTFVFNIPSPTATFVFSVPNVTYTSGGSSGGTVNVYLDGVLQSSTASSDLDAEIVNILWT
jgi:hypothetical protein